MIKKILLVLVLLIGSITYGEDKNSLPVTVTATIVEKTKFTLELRAENGKDKPTDEVLFDFDEIVTNKLFVKSATVVAELKYGDDVKKFTNPPSFVLVDNTGKELGNNHNGVVKDNKNEKSGEVYYTLSASRPDGMSYKSNIKVAVTIDKSKAGSFSVKDDDKVSIKVSVTGQEMPKQTN